MPIKIQIRGTTVTPDHAFTLYNASQHTDGLMSKEDKIKLDNLVPGGGGTLAQSYNAGATADAQTLNISALRGGQVRFSLADIAQNYGPDYVAASIVNPTVATNDVPQQNSPALRFAGSSLTLEGSADVEHFLFTEVVTSGFSPSADFVIGYRVNGVLEDRLRLSAIDGIARIGSYGLHLVNAINGQTLIYDDSGQDFKSAFMTLARAYAGGQGAVDQTIVIENANGGPPQISRANIGATSSPGLIIKTGTPGTALQTQYSPSILMRGSADDSGAVDVDFYMQVATQNGTGGDATGALVVSSSVGGGPSTPLFAVLQAAVGTVRIGSTPLQVSAAAINQSLVFNGTGFFPGNGGGRYPYTLLPDADYVATIANCYMDASAQTADREVTLPLAATAGEGCLMIVAVGNHNLTLTATGPNTIDGSAQKYPGPFTVWHVVSDGVNTWRVVSVLTTVP